MKKIIKKTLCVLLAAVLLLSSAPISEISEIKGLFDFSLRVSAETYGVLEYEIVNGEVKITDCDVKASGEITIPDTIEGYAVTSIGGYAFLNCSDLTNITIPNSVISIADYAFSYCNGLTSITIPDSVSSIGTSTFNNCMNLVSITVSYDNANFSSDGNGVLYNKRQTGLIRYPAGKTSTEYIIPDSVKRIRDYAFSDCSSLTNITIPGSVTSIGENAFSFCNGLTILTIPDSVTTIGRDAFTGCSRLTNITIPNSVTSIGENAFLHCNSLTSIIIPDSVTSIGKNTFDDCSSLTSIAVSSSNTRYSSDSNGVLFNKNKTELIRCPIGITSTEYIIPDSVTSVDEWSFSYCKSLTSITIPDSVTSIGQRAFIRCSRLKSIRIPDSVTSIKFATFSECSSLTNITIPDSVTNMEDHIFSYCTGLTDITISNSVTSIGDYTFYHCGSLTNITIPESVTSIEGKAFLECTGLTSVIIPNSITSIGEDAFKSCTNLKELYLGSNVVDIRDNAFSGCPNLSIISVTSNDFSAENAFDSINPKMIFVAPSDNTNAKAFAQSKGCNLIEYKVDDKTLDFKGNTIVYSGLQYNYLTRLINEYSDLKYLHFDRLEFDGVLPELIMIEDCENVDTQSKNFALTDLTVSLKVIADNQEEQITFAKMLELLESGNYDAFKLVIDAEEDQTEQPFFQKIVEIFEEFTTSALRAISKAINFITSIFKKKK